MRCSTPHMNQSCTAAATQGSCEPACPANNPHPAGGNVSCCINCHSPGKRRGKSFATPSWEGREVVHLSCTSAFQKRCRSTASRFQRSTVSYHVIPSLFCECCLCVVPVLYNKL